MLAAGLIIFREDLEAALLLFAAGLLAPGVHEFQEAGWWIKRVGMRLAEGGA